MNQVATFQQRFCTALNVRGLRQIDVAKGCNIPKGIIHHYVNGVSKPKMDKLEVISKFLKVDIAWLMGLDVPMDAESEHHYELREKIKDLITYAPDDVLEKVITYLNDIYYKK